MKIFNSIFFICLYFASFGQPQDKAVVSVDRQHIIYLGIDNPISIAIPGFSCAQTYATINNGKMTGSGCVYSVYPKFSGKTTISVYSIIKTDTTVYTMDDTVSIASTVSRWDTIATGKYYLRADSLPDPVVKISGKRNEAVSKGWLMAQQGPYAELENLDIHAKFKIQSFKMRYYSNNKEVKSVNVSGTLFNADCKELFNICFKGDVFRLCNVKATGPDGIEKELEPVEYYIEQKF